MMVYDFEKMVVVHKIKELTPSFKFRELKEEVGVHPVKLRVILSILKEEGIIEKEGRRWRVKND